METKDTVGIIERLEAASGPDRELDRAIFDTVTGGVFGPENAKFWHSTSQLSRAANEFTSSIDAALTLVPPNTYYMLGYGKTREPEPLGACAFFRPGEDEPFVQAEAPTIALALCLTALRARAQGE